MQFYIILEMGRQGLIAIDKTKDVTADRSRRIAVAIVIDSSHDRILKAVVLLKGTVQCDCQGP